MKHLHKALPTHCFTFLLSNSQPNVLMLHSLSLSHCCTDIDECTEGSHDCDSHATCANTIGSHDCTCTVGFTGNGISCGQCDIMSSYR